jgi:hypothetical protein
LSSDRVAYNAHGRSIAAQWTPISCSGHFALMGAAHITSVAVSHMKWAGPYFPHSDNPVLQNLNENHGSGIKAKHLQSFSSSQNLSLSAVPSSKLQSMASHHHHSHGDHHHAHGCALAIHHSPLFRSVVIAVRTCDSLPVWPCHFRDGAAAAAVGVGSWIGEDGRVWHSHDGLAPHSHEPIYSPGDFTKRAQLRRPRLHRRHRRPRGHRVILAISGILL